MMSFLPQARLLRPLHYSLTLGTRLSRWQLALTSKILKNRRRFCWSTAHQRTQSNVSSLWLRAKISLKRRLANNKMKQEQLTNPILMARACSISLPLVHSHWILSMRPHGKSLQGKSRAQTSRSRSLTARAKFSRKYRGTKIPSQKSTALSM